MTVVFVDTSAFCALAARTDRNHRRARAFLRSLPRSGRGLLTSTDVFDETVTLLRHRLGHGTAVAVGGALMSFKWGRVVDVMDEIPRSARNLFLLYAHQWFSFTECTSLATIKSLPYLG